MADLGYKNVPMYVLFFNYQRRKRWIDQMSKQYSRSLEFLVLDAHRYGFIQHIPKPGKPSPVVSSGSVVGTEICHYEAKMEPTKGLFFHQFWFMES